MSNTIIAAYWMIGAMFSFSLMAVGGRELGGLLDTFEIMTYRSLVGVLIVLFVVFYKRQEAFLTLFKMSCLVLKKKIINKPFLKTYILC